MNKHLRPVVALDIDGVINAGGSPQRLGRGWELHRIEIPPHHPSLNISPFSAVRPERGMALTVNINPRQHGRWITELQNHAEVVWATTWEHAANHALAPLLGIGPLPVGTSVEQTPPTQEQIEQVDIAGWKAMALNQLYPDQAVVWIDDSNGAFSGGAWQAEHYGGEGTAPRLALTADPEYGLTEELMDVAYAFVKSHPGFSAPSVPELIQLYTDKQLSRSQLVWQLCRWPYRETPYDWDAMAIGLDDGSAPAENCWEDVMFALHQRRIDSSIYAEVLETTRDDQQELPPEPTVRGLAEKYAAGDLSREELVEELTAFQYVPQRTIAAYEDFHVNPPNTTSDVGFAHHRRLIDFSIYEEVMETLHRREKL